MLDAAGIDQVLAWKDRQLGGEAKVSSVLELEDTLPDGTVEKSGTGISLTRAGGCKVVLSFTAESVQRVVGPENEEVLISDWCRMAELRKCNATVH